ncbi:MAG: hypothetical protein AB1414_05610 [bacterium]
MNILIVNNYSLQENTPLGITLRNLLFHYNLMEVYNLRSVKYQDQQLPYFESFQISKNKKIINDMPFELRSKFNKVRYAKIKEYVKYTKSLFHVLSKKNIQRIKEFNPDIIYTIGESYFAINFSSYLSKLLDINVIYHFMDNWIDTSFNIVKNRLINRLILGKIYNQMTKSRNALVISDLMKKEYENRFKNIEFHVIGNILTNNNLTNLGLKDGKEFQLLYMGGLHIGRIETIMEMCKLLDSQRLMNVPFMFNIYVPKGHYNKYQHLFNFKNSRIFNEVDNTKAQVLIRKADILIHVESFKQENIEYTKYSLSTKITEYISAGRPIIIYGPSEINSAQYIVNNQIGFNATTIDSLIVYLQNIIQNYDEIAQKINANSSLLFNKRHSYEYRNSIFNKLKG